MENIIILLACVVMTTAAGNYKLFKMEKTEKIEVRESISQLIIIFLYKEISSGVKDHQPNL
jgi:Fic family protein